MSLKSKIVNGYNDAKLFLKGTTIPFRENIIRNNNLLLDNYSKEFIDVSQNNDYQLVYHIARRKMDYNILLEDNSFFQFGYREKDGEIINITYAYYEMPIVVKPFKAFENEYYKLYPQGIEELKTVAELYEDYTQYISEAPKKDNFFPIRYDYDVDGYRGLRHPKSHLHIGHNTQLRIPLSTIIFPREFVAFIFRHVYFDDWVECIGDSSFLGAYKKIKDSCIPLGNESFNENERNDFFIA
jgi:hypothetical protein